MSPVARQCVPPHSSMLKPGTDTTRTLVAVLLAEERHGAAAIASSVRFTSVCTGVLR